MKYDVLLISEERPLSKQLFDLTGDTYNEYIYDILMDGEPFVIKHKELKKVFIVYSDEYVNTSEMVISEEIKYIKQQLNLNN